MRSCNGASGSVPLTFSRRRARVVRALHHFDAVGRNFPERAWELFNRECPWWLRAVFGASDGAPDEAPEVPAHVEHGVAHPVQGGHEVSGVWSCGARTMGGGDWTVVRARVRPAGAPPEPRLYAVHEKQWQGPRGASAGRDRRSRVLTNAFVPDGLISHAPVAGRSQGWPADAVLVGSVSLSLGVAAAALGRAKGSAVFRSAGGPAGAELAPLIRQQHADFELAVMQSANLLGTAVEAPGRASTAGERDIRPRGLAETMRSASAIAQQATAFAYEFQLGSDDVTERQVAARFMENIAPVLQNSRFAGDFLEIIAQNV